jgi:hypothetical protein
MSEEEWIKYVDTGRVSHDTIKDIVKKIKSNEILSLRFISIYNSYAELIEVLLKIK